MTCVLHELSLAALGLTERSLEKKTDSDSGHEAAAKT